MASVSGKTDKTVRRKSFEIFTLVGLLGYVSFWSLPGLIGQYSFWRDEIFTVAFISGSWIEMFRDWIGPDVHPPLYFIFAKVWSTLLGTSELSLRGLSFLCALGTIALLWNDWRQNKRMQRLIALLFITTSPAFLYYSQEARSYTLILFLSCWLMLRMYNHRDGRNDSANPKATQNTLITYTLCIVLSLTHYFGFIFSFFILAIDCLDRSICKRRYWSAIVIGIICLWPAFHMGYLGNLGDVQQEKLSALTTTYIPVISTAEAYIYSSLYFLNSGIKALNIAMISILAFAIVRFYFKKKSKGKLTARSRKEFNYSIIVIGLIVTSLAIIEIFWPITTARNFIILLYPTAIAIASIFESAISDLNLSGVGRKSIGMLSIAGLSMILLLSSKISTNNLNLKVHHGVDYKSLAAYLKANDVCSSGCLTLDYDPQGNNFGDRIDDYYFGDLELFSYKKITSLDNANFNSLPIIGSYKTTAEIKEFAQQLPNRRLITSCSNNVRPDQSTPFVLIARDQKASEDNYQCITNYK